MNREFDPVVVEIVQNELAAITEEMAIVIWRTGQSAMMKAGDFATAVCDSAGRVVGQGFAAPMQLAIFDELLKNVLARYGSDFSQGDVIITNDPYAGMTHMPDIAVVVPVIVDRRVGAFCVAYSHHSDVGGRLPGSSSSECRTSYEEGIRIPILKLANPLSQDDPVFSLVRANVRVPDEWQSDMHAKVAGCLKGAEQAERLIRSYGWEAYESACNHVIDHACQSTRAAIAQVPDGVFHAEYVLPDDEKGGADIVLKLALKVSGDRITVDFTGSSDQVDLALNSPLTMTKAAVSSALKTIIGPDLPMNRGFSEPIEVIAPAGTVLNPIFPGATGGRAAVFYGIFDVVNRALAAAMPDRVPVIGEGADLLHYSGRTDSGEEFAFIDLFYGGWGARPTKDGIDGVAPVFLGSYGCASAELLEAEYPVILDRFGFEPDSAGAGKYRGSVAVSRQWRFRSAGHAMLRSVRLGPPPAFEGGSPGAIPRTRFVHRGKSSDLELKTHVHLKVEAGDQIFHSTAGAGGYGDPFTRRPELVQADYRAGLVTRAGALHQFGTYLKADGDIDHEETQAARDASVSTLLPAKSVELKN
jgi:N-methylhydantoinase B